MKTIKLAAALSATLLFVSTTQATMIMESFPARVGLGTTDDSQGFTGFFKNGFVQGSVLHTDTVSYDDGIVKIDIDMTVEGFDETTAAAGLRTTSSAVGVDGTGDTVSESTRMDAGEKIKVTFNDISFSIIGAHPSGPVDPSSFTALISSIRLAAFDAGTDTFTYAGLAAGTVVGDDTDTIDFVPDQVVDDGDMFMITADSGLFRGLYISMSGNYKVIPEPATLALMGISLLALGASRRK